MLYGIELADVHYIVLILQNSSYSVEGEKTSTMRKFFPPFPLQFRHPLSFPSPLSLTFTSLFLLLLSLSQTSSSFSLTYPSSSPSLSHTSSSFSLTYPSSSLSLSHIVFVFSAPDLLVSMLIQVHTYGSQEAVHTRKTVLRKTNNILCKVNNVDILCTPLYM